MGMVQIVSTIAGAIVICSMVGCKVSEKLSNERVAIECVKAGGDWVTTAREPAGNDEVIRLGCIRKSGAPHD